MANDVELLRKQNVVVEKSADPFDYQFFAQFAHSAVHRDVIAQASDYVASTASREYLIETPAGVNPHLIFGVSASDATRVQFFEGSTKTTGTPLITARLNRTSGEVTQTAISHSPGGSGDGTELPGAWVPASGGFFGGAAGSVVIHQDAEWLLKSDAKYLVVLTASAGTTISTKFEWYE